MLLGRERERAMIDALLLEARTGISGTLVILGEAGIGKSALIDETADAASDMLVLRSRGLESESELPFSALADLVHPLLDRLSVIPFPQRDALSAALALEASTGPVDRFAVNAGTLSLLATAAAEGGPLLAIVDDAQWIDTGSAEAIWFAARRLEQDATALLVAIREGEGRAIDTDGFPTLRLEGLDRAAARALLASAGHLTADVQERIMDLAQGNPLALLELQSQLSDTERSGDAPLSDPLPPSPHLVEVFRRRMEASDPATRRALLVAAASSGDIGVVLTAMKTAGLPATALEAAEDQGLIEVSAGHLSFRHPLLRSTIYHAASAPDRRAAHQALAESFVEDEEERAWHLAAAAVVPNEAAAAALERAGESARRRGAPAVAAHTFALAAHLSPDPSDRSARVIAAATAGQLAGRPAAAIRLLDEAYEQERDPLRRTQIGHLRARVSMWLGRPLDAYTAMVAEGRAQIPLDPVMASLTLSEACLPCFTAGRYEDALATAREAFAVAVPLGGPPALIATLALAGALELTGDEVEADGLFGHCRPLVEQASDLASIERVHTLARALMYRDDFVGARSLLHPLIAEARRVSAVGLLPFPLTSLAELDFRTGHWRLAYAEATEAVELAHETGQAMDIGLLTLALIEAGLDRADDCRTHVVEGRRLMFATGNEGLIPWAGKAIGLLDLGHGMADEAAVELEAVAVFCSDRGLRAVGAAQWEGDLVEALILTGRTEEATRRLDAFRDRASGSAHPGAQAVASRCSAMIAAPKAWEDHFREAIGFHDRSGVPFERARTLLAFGERMRREHRRREGEQPLREALAIFDMLGAVAWAHRTREELRAAGSRMVPAPAPGGLRELTPQELQIGLLVADGATNHEVAAALFLSEKTVEMHLTNAYRKLAVRSRTELARLVLTRDPTEIA